MWIWVLMAGCAEPVKDTEWEVTLGDGTSEQDDEATDTTEQSDTTTETETTTESQTETTTETETESQTETETETETETTPNLAIAGNYTDNQGNEHLITNALWSIDYGANDLYEYYITQYDNLNWYVIAENSASNGAPEAGAWSRFDWTFHNNQLWFCQTIFDAPSEAAALQTPAPDASDPTQGGCDGYGWWRLYQ